MVGRVANIASYEVNDPRTITITLNDVQADFLDGLVPLSIISPEIVGEHRNCRSGHRPVQIRGVGDQRPYLDRGQSRLLRLDVAGCRHRCGSTSLPSRR